MQGGLAGAVCQKSVFSLAMFTRKKPYYPEAPDTVLLFSTITIDIAILTSVVLFVVVDVVVSMLWGSKSIAYVMEFGT